jgi:hypothetical protein
MQVSGGGGDRKWAEPLTSSLCAGTGGAGSWEKEVSGEGQARRNVGGMQRVGWSMEREEKEGHRSKEQTESGVFLRPGEDPEGHTGISSCEDRGRD